MSIHGRDYVGKAWPYVAAAPAGVPVTLADVKAFLRIDTTADDTLLTALITAATNFAEKYTRRYFIQRSVVTYRDSFADELELRRAPLESVTSVQYLKDAVLTTVSTDVYFATVSDTFSYLALKPDQAWPTDADDQEQAVKITFAAGIAATEADVPEDIKTAIYNLIAAMYANRGDCSCDFTDMGSIANLMPAVSRIILNQYRIRDIWSV